MTWPTYEYTDKETPQGAPLPVIFDSPSFVTERTKRYSVLGFAVLGVLELVFPSSSNVIQQATTIAKTVLGTLGIPF